MSNTMLKSDCEIKINQYQQALNRIASRLGVSCSGVDVPHPNGLGSYTSEEIVSAIDTLKTELIDKIISDIEDMNADRYCDVGDYVDYLKDLKNEN